MTRLVPPCLIFSPIYGVATILETGANQDDPVDPFWLMWFLPALAAWRLGTPVLLFRPFDARLAGFPKFLYWNQSHEGLGQSFGVGWSGDDDRVSGGPVLVLILVGCVLVSAALASPPVRWLARPLVEPHLGWLLAPQPPERPGQRSKSSVTSSVTGRDWQASTNPAAISSRPSA